MFGSPKDMPLMHALIAGKNSGQFDAAMQEAMKTYHEDVDSNVLIRECWPSSQAFRNILYCAAKKVGEPAAAYLQQTPDADLRLFAQIELVAGLVGLPQHSGIRISAPKINLRSLAGDS